jgi:hypothetical protein
MDGISIDFVYSSQPSSSELRTALTHLLEWDSCTSEKNGQSEQCSYFLGWDGESQDYDSSPSKAVEDLSECKAGSVTLFLHGSEGFDPLAISLQFIDDSVEEFHIDAPDQFLVSIKVDNVYLNPRKRSDEELLAYSKRLLTLTKTVYEVANPIHVVGFRVMPGVEASFFPVSTLEIGEVEIVRPVDWLAVFEPETLDRLGRDWLDDIEFWHREQLDDGAELIALGPLPNGAIDERLDEVGKHM